MSDAPTPEPLDGEVLSAYLTGELDADAAAAVDERLAHDRALGRRLDATARMLGALRGVDAVELPAGAAQRLRQRLAEAGAEPGANGDGAVVDAEPGANAGGAVAGAGPVVDAEPGADARDAGGALAGADSSRDEPAPVTTLASRRRVPWSAVAGVAAGLVAVALVGGGLIQGFGGLAGQDSEGTDTAMDAPEADDGGMRQFAETESELAEEQAADGDHVESAPAAPVPSAADAGDLPTLRDRAVPLAGEAAVRARYEGLAEASAVLGETLAAAEEHAVAARATLAGAPPFRTGVHPGACLDDGGEGGPVVPVLVESAVLDGRPVLIAVLVTASPGAGTLDRVTVQVRASADCTHVLDVDLG